MPARRHNVRLAVRQKQTRPNTRLALRVSVGLVCAEHVEPDFHAVPDIRLPVRPKLGDPLERRRLAPLVHLREVQRDFGDARVRHDGEPVSRAEHVRDGLQRVLHDVERAETIAHLHPRLRFPFRLETHGARYVHHGAHVDRRARGEARRLHRDHRAPLRVRINPHAHTHVSLLLRSSGKSQKAKTEKLKN